jgi:hypothetical protein
MRLTARFLSIVGLLFCLTHAATAQTADEIVEKHIAASGGRDALLKLKSRRMTGTISLMTPVGNISGDIEVTNEAPNKSRSVMKIDLPGGLGQMTVDQRFDGQTGYVLDTLQGNRDITGNQLENMKSSFFPTPLLNYKDHGATVELAGKEKAGNRDAYVLLFKPKTGSVLRIYLDASTYLPIKTVVKIDVPQLGRELEQTNETSDYRDVNGIKVPFQMTAISEVQTYTITVKRVEHDVTLDDSLFSKP